MFRHLNRANSILNNTILSIFKDREGDLWLGLDNGIAHVEVESPVSLYADNTGELGTVYAISGSVDSLLLGSNHGLFQWQGGKIQQVPGSQGQVWDITKIGHRYLVGHNDGFYEFESGNFQKINEVTGGWRLFKSRFNGTYLQATYTGIATYRSITNLETPRYIPGLTKPIRDAVEESPTILWAADNYRGLYRISGGNYSEKVDNITENQQFPNDYNVKLVRFNQRVYSLIQQQWYEYDQASGKLVQSKWLNKALEGVSDVFQISDREILINARGILYRVNLDGRKFQWKIIPPKYYIGKLVAGNTRAFKTNKAMLINLDDGFLVVSGVGNVAAKIKVEGFSSGKLIQNGQSIGYGKAVQLRVISDAFGYKKPSVYFRVDNGKAVNPVANGRIVLNNLAGGTHRVV
ncbi:MAG: histidine kinase, partial [Chitinophagaceae bacterium]